MLSALVAQLRQSLGILHKQDIQTAATRLNLGSNAIQLGDDCAAIPDGDGYLLFAAEGMLPLLVESEPWFAGWCGVLVSVSDIYAMGGRPIAVVDALWSTSAEATHPIWQGMTAAAQTYSVPIVGGHTNCHSPYNALSVAILGRAKQLITSFNAQPGDALMVAIDFRGKPHPKYPFWDAATRADPVQLRADLALLPDLAESGLCDAGKDISMGGIVGTLLMLLETSNCGAVLNVDQVPCPTGLDLDRWLVSFPSYGFLLSVRGDRVAEVQAHFRQRDLVCEVIGTVEPTHQLELRSHSESAVFWDFTQQPLTGFAPR
ncbi:sll0787 family AIR synthase-like protein [Oscillatoria sp. FACHB-1407]|uniref:sll0787 family AIR synthase-like protein n=1 Tax=Oscillatoria sp. FACHB-1407 TaxID=2692847 RepID=UPI001686D284|nr:sll0787 family AIR synthase-like protein [Oscillatoria sp. FACHB-1407]MBD2461261.1 sll0787 family AIR synthase-like protein [Oscillatoria sp. FACHB-1407]